MKCFCAILLTSAVVLVAAQNAKDEPEGLLEDYDSFYDYDALKAEGDKLEAELDKLEQQNDLKVQEDIDKFREDQDYEYKDDVLDDYQFEDNRDKPKDNKGKDDNDDEKRQKDAQADYALLWGDDSVAPLPVPEIDSSNDDETQKMKDDDDALEDILRSFDEAGAFPEDKHNEDIIEETKNILENTGDSFNDDEIKMDKLEDEIIPSDNKDKIEVNKEIEPKTFDDIPVEEAVDDHDVLKDKNNENIIAETKQILENTGDSFIDDEVQTDEKTIDESKNLNEENVALDNVDETVDSKAEEAKPKINEDVPIKTKEDIPIKHNVEKLDEQDQAEDVKADENSLDAVIPEEDTVDKVYADLHDDLDKLLDTLDKLSDDGDIGDEKLEEVYDKLDEHFFKDDNNEELAGDNKNDADYSDIDLDKILEDIFNEDDMKVDDAANAPDEADIDLKVKLDEQMNEPNPDDAFESDVEPLPEVNAEPNLPYLDAIVDTKNDAEYSDTDFQKIIDDIFNKDDMKVDDAANAPDEVDIELEVKLDDEMNEPNPNDAVESDVEPLLNVNAEPILPYLDAIVDEPKDVESIEKDNVSAKLDASIEAKSIDDKFDTVDIDTLNSSELEGLVKQFSMVNNEVLDTHSKTFEKDTAPVHIKLNIDEPVVITSPNYPSAYPTNNIVDWIIDGDGVGIEMNITDFLVNGAMGDYLLVKPGGVDDLGHDGLLFTYRLNSEKRFLFSDVDRLFVRFEASPAMWNIMRGFQMSVKMISPLPEDPEPLPEPEAVLEHPHSLHTIYLASAIPQFKDLNETFRILLADMADEYIADKGIDRGVNTTQEVTQITSISVCPITWPHFELCSAVTFGVSLVEGDEGMLDEEALEEMWEEYSTRDPYALRLRRMGIAEFDQPSSSVMTSWLVIASGVVIATMMMTFLIWRYNCFKDYTRMQTYSDTDSLQNEKRGLDLYPTPHQTLPALYAESEYKWQENEDTTRVDIGGFANKTYARDMYDFDSDEDVIPPRERNSGTVTARDVYNGSVA